MPATPADAKGLLLAAVADPNPVLYIDDRWLYSQTGPVPEEIYRTPIGEAAVRRAGRDVTIVGISWMAAQALEAAEVLAGQEIEAEVIDLRSLKPWDQPRVYSKARARLGDSLSRIQAGGRRARRQRDRGDDRSRSFPRSRCAGGARDASGYACADQSRRRAGILSGTWGYC